MPESRMLLTAAAALLILALGLHWPALTRRVPRPLWWLMGAGSVLPLLDPAWSHLSSEDQIALLTRTPLFAGPLAALGAVALLALGVTIWRGARPGLRVLASAAAGLALNLGLTALTPWGVPWLAPFSTERWGWALFPAGQTPAVGLLAAWIAALELWPAWGRALRWSAVAGAVLYGAVALSGYFWAATHAPAAQAGERVIEPDGIWPLRWLVIDRTPGEFRVQRWSLGASSSEGQDRVARWNDEPLFLRELADPVVFRLYSRAFLHPIAELSRSGSQTILTMQELSFGLSGTPGPTFMLKSDLDGRNRLYRLERFD